MKKTIKILAVIGTVLVFLGVGTMGAVVVMGYDYEAATHYLPMRWLWDGEEVRTEDLGEETYSFAGINRLDLKADGAKVEIVRDTSLTEVAVSVRSSGSGYTCDISGEDGELSVDCKLRLRGMSNDGICEIRIAIPEDIRLQESDIEVNAGELNAVGLALGELDLKINGADVLFEQCEAVSGTFRVNAGRGSYTGRIDGSVDGQCSAGQLLLTLDGNEEEYNYQLENSAGHILLGETTYEAFHSNQNIDNNADKEMELECAMGGIEVTFRQDE